MRHSAAISTEIADELAGHLLRPDGQEDLCFATYYPSRGRHRTSGILSKAILPGPGERHVHGTASFETDYFLRAADVAAQDGAGLAFLHSHPRGVGWQGMSQPDRRTERRFAARATTLTGHPLLGLTMAGDRAVAARFWERVGRNDYQRADCESVRKVGEGFDVTWNDKAVPPTESTPLQIRTVSAWGDEVQADLARLRVGVIGAGSVGALVAEALARMGIGHIALFDFDGVEEHNLDRLLHATALDVRLARSKVEVLKRNLLRAATARAPMIDAFELSVVEDDGYRAALDFDLLFSCVDRPWPRSALNHIALAHLVPVVDVGIGIRTTRGGKLRSARWHAQTVAPGRRCLECSGQVDPADVPLERDGSLNDPSYIDQLPDGHRLRARQNVFPFSMAASALALEQALRMVVAPGNFPDAGAQRHEFKPGKTELELEKCNLSCPYAEARATGEKSFEIFKPTGPHDAAVEVRKDRAEAKRKLRVRLGRVIDDGLWWVWGRL